MTKIFVALLSKLFDGARDFGADALDFPLCVLTCLCGNGAALGFEASGEERFGIGR
jgi:hypothetical protein